MRIILSTSLLLCSFVSIGHAVCFNDLQCNHGYRCSKIQGGGPEGICLKFAEEQRPSLTEVLGSQPVQQPNLGAIMGNSINAFSAATAARERAENMRLQNELLRMQIQEKRESNRAAPETDPCISHCVELFNKGGMKVPECIEKVCSK